MISLADFLEHGLHWVMPEFTIEVVKGWSNMEGKGRRQVEFIIGLFMVGCIKRETQGVLKTIADLFRELR